MNEARRTKRFERQFHSWKFVSWIRTEPCIGCGDTPSEASHIRSRRWSSWRDVVPMCRPCHRAFDAGKDRWARTHGIDIERAAAETAVRFEAALRTWEDLDE